MMVRPKEKTTVVPMRVDLGKVGFTLLLPIAKQSLIFSCGWNSSSDGERRSSHLSRMCKHMWEEAGADGPDPMKNQGWRL